GKRSGFTDGAARMAWHGVRAARNTGGRGSVPDFLSFGRHGWRRREVDGGLRRAARGETAVSSGFVDGRLWRRNGAGGYRRRFGSRALDAPEILGRRSN